jgi:hypothetical protein
MSVYSKMFIQNLLVSRHYSRSQGYNSDIPAFMEFTFSVREGRQQVSKYKMSGHSDRYYKAKKYKGRRHREKQVSLLDGVVKEGSPKRCHLRWGTSRWKSAEKMQIESNSTLKRLFTMVKWDTFQRYEDGFPHANQ